MSLLCLTLCRASLSENLQDLRHSQPELAELRIDLLDQLQQDELIDFPRKAGIPLILTCRKTVDGGAWTGSDSQRETLLLELMDGGFSYIDLEEDEDSAALQKKAEEQGISIIRSIHDFDCVPANLEERLESMLSRGSLVKAAVMPQGVKDLLRLFEIGSSWKRKHPGSDDLILLGMGGYGVPTRILAPILGSFLTFCSPAGSEAAPGHMSYETLHDLYRVQDLTAETSIFGIIGNPVLHSQSPQIHNPGLRSAGINGVYMPFMVDDVRVFFDLAAFLDIKGFSVTIPHKQGVRAFLECEDEAVQAVGACNTVVRMGGSHDGWEGFNTDVIGFIEPLKAVSGPLMGKKTAVIGAGGAARSAVFALCKEGCDVNIFNRSEGRALALAEDFSCSGGSLTSLEEKTEAGESFDLIIQTSSAGMHGPLEDIDPISFYVFKGNEILYDIIYTPPVTPVMKRAASAGCLVLGGFPMLQEQAKAQFRLFTGKNLP